MHCTTKNPPMLHNVHFTDDGTSVAFDGRMLVAVSPVLPAMLAQVPLENSKDCGAITISSETIKEILKNLPSDKKFHGVLEHCDLDGSGKFTMIDGSRRLKSISGKVFSREFLDFRKVFKKAKSSPVKARVVLNRARLASLLEFFDKACPDSSNEAPVYLDFTEDGDILARVENATTQQRAIGFMTAYKAEEGVWMESDAWEEGLSGKESPEASKGVKK
jgi:hypothetical protein